MRLDLDNLPSDPALLHRVVPNMAAAVAHRDGEIERLHTIIKQLQRAQFGRRSERLDADQLALGLEDIEADVGRVEASAPVVVTGASPARPRRQELPDHLPRDEVLIGTPSAVCPCCGGALHSIGESVSEMLDWVPAEFRVVRTVMPCLADSDPRYQASVLRAPPANPRAYQNPVIAEESRSPGSGIRPKFACRACNQIVQAAAPDRVIAGGLATPALLVQVLVSKYGDHTPFTVSRKSSRVMASPWSVRRRPAGWAGPVGGSKHCTIGSPRTCSRPTICSPMTRPYRCWIPVAGAPKPDACGYTRVTSARGADPHRPRPSTSLRLTAKPSVQHRIWNDSAACCTSMAMRGLSD
jgi:transposase